jgi:hypothetical protein
MKIKINNNIIIPSELELKEHIEDFDFLNFSVNYVDDGYELTELEKNIYQKNNVFVDQSFLNHITCCKEWFTIESDNVYCDHASILFRYSLKNYFNQIQKLKNVKKELIRFYDIKTKYGLDFYFQYLGDDFCFDIIHIENDYLNKQELMENKQKIEDFVLKIDWEDVGTQILNKRDQWENLPKDDQYDWKARYFGFPRAFFTKK